MRRIISLLVVAAIAGCTPALFGHLTSLETKPDEAIVIGHIRVVDQGRDITTETNLIFNETVWGKYVYRADTTGYICTKLKVGKNHLARLAYKNRRVDMPDDYATVTLGDPARVYYIGDITIDVTGRSHVGGGALFGLVGALADAGSKGTQVPIEVADNPQPAIDYFRTTFPNRKEVATSILVVGAGARRSAP